MDLLLHLVEQQEVPVSEVDMSAIAGQYLKVIASAEYIDLEQAAEYLVIAATLTAIKSHRLLPASEELPPGIEGFDGQNSEEFYEELRRRLAEYELTKRRATALACTPQLGIDSFSRRGITTTEREELIEPVDFLIKPGDHLSLGQLFYKVLNRIGGLRSTFRIKVDPVSIVSMMMKTIDALTISVERKINFSSMLRKFTRRSSAEGKLVQGDIDRNTVIGSFIAILELMKRGVVSASQLDQSSDIQIEMKMESESAVKSQPLESEFDEPMAEVISLKKDSADNFETAETLTSKAQLNAPGVDECFVTGNNASEDEQPEMLRAVGI